MPIQEQNIKLLASQVMADVDEGGGQATGTVIADGASNAIFPDISELDRTIGRVNLRKVFVNIDTADVSEFLGANIIVAEPPQDDNVSCTIFTTDDGFDTRSVAKSRLEAYVIRGPLSKMRLYGTQVEGQRAVLAYQRVEETLPEVGQVYVLSVENSQGVSTLEQFFRITEVTHEIRTFTDANGDFQRRVLTLRISDALRSTFVGLEPVRASSDSAATKIRSTQVADTTTYYSTTPLAEALSVGDLTVKVDSIFSQIVPSSTAESPISLARVPAADGLVASTETPRTVQIYNATSDSVVGYTAKPITPGTLSLTCSGFSAIDDGNGELSGTLVDASAAATVDYASGLITFLRVASASGAVTATYTPAGEVTQAAHTHEVPVTLATRGSVYSLTLKPAPAPGSLIVDYLALGKWYRLKDNGTGTLEGADASVGSGAVQYGTGAVVVTLGALPDVDSAVLLWWGSKAHYVQKAGAASAAPTGVNSRVTMQRFLTKKPVVPETLVVSWTVGGSVRTATTNSGGVIAGTDLSGTVNKTTGEVNLQFARFPDKATAVQFAYDYLNPDNPNDSVFHEAIVTTNGTTVSAGTDLLPGTVTVSLDIDYGRVIAKDDGAGNIILPSGQHAGDAYIEVQQVIGTVNYATGVVTITQQINARVNEYQSVFFGPSPAL